MSYRRRSPLVRQKSSFLSGRNRFLSFIVLLVLTAIIASRLSPDPPPGSAGNQTVDGAIEISAVELARVFLGNPGEANRQYRKEVVRVTGEVFSTGSILAKTYVKFRTGEDSSNLQYFANNDNRRLIEELEPGDTVSVTGVCQGIFSNVVVVE